MQPLSRRGRIDGPIPPREHGIPVTWRATMFGGRKKRLTDYASCAG
jgi:hypothetical protein